MELNKINKEIAILENNLDLSNIYSDEFQQLTNGLFQAEGTIGVYFYKRESLKLVFYFSIGQNYSKESCALLLMIKAVLGVGRVKAEIITNGNIHLKYIISNTQDILEKAVPYFKYIYGPKKSNLETLNRVYSLYIRLKSSSQSDSYLNEVSELIHLVYSMNVEGGQARKYTLAEKLSEFDCSEKTPNLEINPENMDLPSKLFIVGMFLGDGSLGFVFDERSNDFKFYIKPVFSIGQKSTKSNVYLLTLIAKVLDIPAQLNGQETATLYCNGKLVFTKIMPLLSKYKN
jgi:hypothetical protein